MNFRIAGDDLEFADRYDDTDRTNGLKREQWQRLICGLCASIS